MVTASARPLRPLAGLVAALILLSAGGEAAADSVRDRDCLPCHVHGAHAGAPRIDLVAYAGSVHAEEGCVHCHTDVEDSAIKHEERDQDLDKVDCGDCHNKQLDAYDSSVHGYGFAEGLSRSQAARCVDCHGAHDVGKASEPGSRTHRDQLATTCAQCHSDAGKALREQVPAGDSVTRYQSGIHAGENSAHRDDGAVVAICTDCHGVHDILPFHSPESKVHRANITTTCSNCHSEAAAEYRRSVHNRESASHERGDPDDPRWDDVPVCTDCHGTHAVNESHSRDFHAQIHTRCARCHGDSRRMARYDITSNVLTSYLDDFHGVTNGLYAEAGAPGGVVATCSDCHESHAVVSFAQLDGHVVREKVAEVCRQCHAGVPDEFADAWLPHEHSFADAPLVWGVKWSYRFIIPLIMLGLLGHIATHLLAFRAGRFDREEP